MVKYLLEFLMIMLLGILLDFFWIGFLSGNLYIDEIGHLLRLSPDGTLDAQIIPALLVYVAFSLGIVTFVDRVRKGAILGLVIYTVYDMTNVSLLKGWSWKLAIIDIAWGTFLLSVLSFCYLSYKKFLQKN
jgi:uncharacterized membrane protein